MNAMVRPGRAAAKVRPARVQPRPTTELKVKYQTATFAPPTLGWVANADPTNPPTGGAAVLDNFFPTAVGAILRRGQDIHTTVSGAVLSLFTFVSGSASHLFAATEDAIYDVSAPSVVEFLADGNGPTFITEDEDDIVITDDVALTPEIDSLTGGYWVTTQFSDVDGEVNLIAVNGEDTPLIYDGASFTTGPGITFPMGAGLTSDVLCYVWSHKNRLFFIEKNSSNAWYLEPYALGGELKKLPLGASMPLGGKLLFGSTWSTDTGSGGLSEQCVFFTTEGEAIVFQGTDPSVAANWSKVGTYRIGKPLGPRAHFRGGGDIATATDIGLIPLSQALQKDFSVLSANAASARIETKWNDAVSARPARNWNCAVWSAKQMVVVAPPPTAGLDLEVYVSNARTGAWARFTSWGGSCIAVWDDRLFVGREDGAVVEENITGLDINDDYTGVYVPLFSSLGGLGTKQVSMSRASLRSPTKLNEKITVQKNYRVQLPTVPASSASFNPNAWGVGEWGVMQWGSPPQAQLYQNWRVTPQVGFVVSPALQVTSGNIVPLDVEIVQLDVAYTMSDVVV